MRRVEGGSEVRLLECTNPKRNKWRVRWDIRPKEDSENIVTYMEEEFDHKPTTEEIRALITGWYNECTDMAILSGFSYENMPVWLSSENQFNYKAAYDLAVQSGGKSLPVTFKFGTDEKPRYGTFTTLEELTDFYTKAMSHIQDTLYEGWRKKDGFNIEVY